jgi:magnesium-transporting ATPase (P-type)
MVFNCINLNHECIVIEDSKTKKSEFSGPSVDEVCLLNMARSAAQFGRFLDRDSDTMNITYPGGEKKSFRVLKVFPFTSERKCSSIVVRDEEGRIFALVKGADTFVAKNCR